MQQPELGHRIASLRRKHNYTQEALAEKLGINSRINYQAIDVINFQISMWIYMMIAGSMVFYIIGLIILPILGIIICVVTIKNTLKVIQSQSYHYPFSIRFLKHM